MQNFTEIMCYKGSSKLYGYYQDNQSVNNLVLIPGSYTHHSIWEPVIRDTNIDANILLPELPGFGKSEPRMPDCTIEEFAEMILHIIDAAGINKFFVGGHSIGGMIAIEFLDLCPERISGVISCEGWTHYSVEKNAFYGLKNQLLTEEQIKLRQYFGTIGRKNWSDEEISTFSKIWKRWNKGKTILDNAEMPVLEIWGDRGLNPRPAKESLMIPEKENIKLFWIKNGVHSMLVQCPTLVGTEIASFINEFGEK